MISNNAYIDKVHDVVNQYNNTTYSTIKWNQDVKSETYIKYKRNSVKMTQNSS